MIPNTIAEIILAILHRMEEVERRFENRERTGTIAEVDAAKGVARVKYGQDPKSGQPLLSPWIPWKELAMGKIKTHFPPEVGEQVKIVSESGDITDAVIDNRLPSNTFKRPHNKAGEAMIKVGENTSVLFTDGQILTKTPHARTESAKVEYDNRGAGGGQKPGAAIS